MATNLTCVRRALALLAGVVAFAFAALAPTISQAGSASGGSGITINFEGLILERGGLDAVNFTGLDDVVPRDTPFVKIEQSDINPDTGYGFRGSIRVPIDGTSIEVGGFVASEMFGELLVNGIEDVNGRTHLIYSDDFNLNTDAGSFANSEAIEALEASHLTFLAGVEANVPVPLGLFGLPGQDNILLGVRGLFLDEELSTVVFDDPDDFLRTDDEIDFARVDTDNRFIGAQIGLQGMLPVFDGLMAGGSIKGGLGANIIDVSSEYFDLRDGDRANRDFGGTRFAQFVEVNPRLKLHVLENVYLSATGTFLWINGNSEAGDYFQSVGIPTDQSIRTDSVFFFGGSLGLTIKFGGGPAQNASR